MARSFLSAVGLLGFLAACGGPEQMTETPAAQPQGLSGEPIQSSTFRADPAGVERRLYVANDKGSIDIFDINDNHRKVRSIPVPGLKRARGWAQTTDLILDRAAREPGLTAIAVNNRFLFYAVSYYGRERLAASDVPPLPPEPGVSVEPSQRS